MGIIIFTLSIFALIYDFDNMFVYGTFCALMGAWMAIVMMPSLTTIQDINWTSDTLNGPNTVTFQVMGLSRNELMWSEIVSIGLVKGPYHYVENKNGARIYWSRSYESYQNFEAVLIKKCPALKWPKFELFPKSNDS